MPWAVVFGALRKGDVDDKCFVKPDAVFVVVSFFSFQSCGSLRIGRPHCRKNEKRRKGQRQNTNETTEQYSKENMLMHM